LYLYLGRRISLVSALEADAAMRYINPRLTLTLTSESLGFCFNAFQLPSSALTRCFCTTVFYVLRPSALVLLQTLIFFIIFSFLGNKAYTYRDQKIIIQTFSNSYELCYFLNFFELSENFIMNSSCFTIVQLI